MMELRKREKNLIAICGAIVLVAVIHFAIISPSLKKRASLKQSIERARLQHADLQLLQHEYGQIVEETKKIKQRMQGRPSGLALFSFLDQTANRLNVKSHLTSMKPSRRPIGNELTEDIVEVRLEGISLGDLVAYLHEIEKTGSAVAIANIRIQPESRQRGGLNVTMLVTSLTTS